jgi:hypothetical protein
MALSGWMGSALNVNKSRPHEQREDSGDFEKEAIAVVIGV